jgi:hypothetical protein
VGCEPIWEDHAAQPQNAAITPKAPVESKRSGVVRPMATRTAGLDEKASPACAKDSCAAKANVKSRLLITGVSRNCRAEDTVTDVSL